MQILVYAGFTLLGLTLGLLLLIAVLDVVRGTPVRRVLADEKGGDPVAIGEPFFRESMELLTHTPLSPAHAVELFINGDETYPRLFADLRAAKSSITIQLYYCNKGRMADTFREILVERARAGVEIHFLYDSFGTSLKEDFFGPLEAAGVHLGIFRPFRLMSMQKAQHRSHIRVIVIDGTIGYTGGFGIDDKWYGDGRSEGHWRDTNVRFVGSAVRQLQAAFTVCWAEATGHLLTGPLLFPQSGAEAAGNAPVLAGLLHASPTIGSTSAERLFVLMITGAQKRLYISNSYFVPTAAFRSLLCAAAGRGVDVRILTVSKASDVKSTWYAGRARYEQLLSGGVRIYEYQPAMMHAKTIVVDGAWSSVGSMNADNRSMSFNEESNLVMLDEGVATRLEKVFEDDIRYSNEIELEEFRKRGMKDRLFEHVSHMIRRVL